MILFRGRFSIDKFQWEMLKRELAPSILKLVAFFCRRKFPKSPEMMIYRFVRLQLR